MYWIGVVNIIVGCNLLQAIGWTAIMRAILVEANRSIGTKIRSIVMVIVDVTMWATHSRSSTGRI